MVWDIVQNKLEPLETVCRKLLMDEGNSFDG